MINNKQDLDSIFGTPEYEEFVKLLSGSIWRIEKTDSDQWNVIEDTSTIERFGLSKTDFLDISPPTIPYYNKIILRNNEIKNRTFQYKSDIKEIQSSWISASISDGEDEITKKQQINQDLIDLKSEYDSDILIIKNKYQN